MDEQHTDDGRWEDLLTRAADGDDQAASFDVADDIARGRTRLRRTQVAVGGAGVLVASVVTGTALLVSPGGSGSAAPQPADGGVATAAPTFQEPSTTLEPELKASKSPKPHGGAYPFGAGGVYEKTRAWRNGVFEITASVLDPEKKYLDYSTDSLQSTSGGRTLALGIKMGWSAPDQPGEGMVQISVTDAQGPHSDESGVYLNAPMTKRTLANGETVKVGHAEGGTFAVSYRQPDGELVWVLVDPLFGNNSTVPVKDMTVTERDVIRLVQDGRLNLPTLD